MKNKGFANHAVMGAIFLGLVWLAIYFPNLVPAIRLGGWTACLAIAAGLMGILAGPLLLVFVEGDEIFGALGIVAALLASWISTRLAIFLEVSSPTLEIARLWGGALGPILLYGSFHLLAKAVQEKK